MNDTWTIITWTKSSHGQNLLPSVMENLLHNKLGGKILNLAAVKP